MFWTLSAHQVIPTLNTDPQRTSQYKTTYLVFFFLTWSNILGNLPHIETRTHRVDKFPSVVSTASSSSKVGITRIQLTLKAKTPPDPMGPTGTEMINSLLADDWNPRLPGTRNGGEGGVDSLTR